MRQAQHSYASNFPETSSFAGSASETSRRIKLDLEVPRTWLTSKLDGERQRLMFSQLMIALANLPLDLNLVSVEHGMHAVERTARPGGVTLSYHSYGASPNVWRIKETSIAGWYSFDPYGFAGWSSLAIEPEVHAQAIDAVDALTAINFVTKMREMLRRGNTSKYTQKNETFTSSHPFVFLPLQRLDDIVAEHYRLNPLEVLEVAARYAAETGIPLVVKRHPLCESAQVAQALREIGTRCAGHVFITDASVHSLLDGCRCVLVANSGVGLEGLLYNKPVVTFGKSEYELGCTPISRLDDVAVAFTAELPDVTELTSKFIYYYLTECCFSMFDPKTIEKCLQKALGNVDLHTVEQSDSSADLDTALADLDLARSQLAESRQECGQLRALASQALDVARRAEANARSTTPGGLWEQGAPAMPFAQTGNQQHAGQSQGNLQMLQRENSTLKERLSLLDGVFPTDTLPEPLPQEFKGFFANRALHKLLQDHSFQTVLDIGSGEGKQAAVMLRHGKSVTALDYGKSPYYKWRDPAIKTVIGDFNTLEFEEQFDCVWASHVLEHQPNPHQFLSKVNRVTKEGGVVSVTVPPLKHQIVGGHLSLWNGGMLLYHMVLAGFDCSEARILQYGYNISIIVQKRKISFPNIVFDMGDIREIRRYLPPQLGFTPNQHDDPFNGDIRRLNW